MKSARFVIPWVEGLHLRPAAELVRLAQRFQSAIVLSCNGRIADARSIANVLLLAASGGAALAVEVTGADEELALHALTQFFQSTLGTFAAG